LDAMTGVRTPASLVFVSFQWLLLFRLSAKKEKRNELCPALGRVWTSFLQSKISNEVILLPML
jgi:hypothetical protein